MTKKKILLSIATSLILTSTSSLAKEAKILEDIVVTAQKTEENIQTIPMSINMLDEFTIEDASIQDTRDIAAYIPNFSTIFNGSRDYFGSFNLRGISNTGIGDPAIAMYIDGISYADLYAFDSPLFEIERIEVLKGPQGTLYGKNTEAGVINIITKAPTNELEGKVNIEVGNYNYKQIKATLNAPIIQDKLFLKLSALQANKDGYITNKYSNTKVDNRDTLSFRTNTIYKVNDNLEASLILSYTKMDDDGGWAMVPMDKNAYATATGYNLNDLETAYDYIGDSLAKTKTSMLKLDYAHDSFDFVSVTGYRNMDNSGTLDGDFTPSSFYGGLNEKNVDSINQEFRLSSNENSLFKWLVGAYYSDEDSYFATGYTLENLAANMYNVPVGTEDISKADIISKDMAIFGQSTVRFFDDLLGVTTGLRYEKSKRGLKNRRHIFGGMDITTPIDKIEKDSSIVLPKLSIDYQLNKDIMFYTTASKGYKAGGYSLAVDDPVLSEYKPEISKSIEVGMKLMFPDLGLMLNVAGFYTKVDDYQDRLQIDPMTVLQANVTKMDIKGFEFEAAYMINEYLTLSGNLGLLSSVYSDYINPLTNENYKDKDAIFTPEYDLNLGIKYRGDNGIFANFELQRTGEQYMDRSNQNKLDAYTVYNTKIGYEQENWDIYFTVKNITDKMYFTSGSVMGDMGYMARVGNPRNLNFAFNYRF